MKQIYSDVIQFRGTHFDFGLFQGEKLKDSLSVINREDQWKVRKPRFMVKAEEVKKAITQFAPGVWDELQGLQAALDWPMERVLKEFGGYRLDYVRSGCSILTGDYYLIRNYDYHPKTYEGRYVIFKPTDLGYAIIGPSQRVTGRMDGMNEKGLALGYNFMKNDIDKGVFSDLYSSWAGTIHTSAYLPREMKAWIALGGNQEPIQFDFAKWLGGEDIEIDRITGVVDTDIPFLHMDENANWFRN